MSTNPDALIHRFDRSLQGTFGQLWTPGLQLFSGELPWLDNLPNVSCVPAGFYRCAWTWSPRFARFMYLLLDTEPRLGVRKHSANLMGAIAHGFRAQLNGCIALGERLGYMAGQKALLLSAPAIRRFEAHMGHAPFLLEIRE
jgi:hypothetical protein